MHMFEFVNIIAPTFELSSLRDEYSEWVGDK